MIWLAPDLTQNRITWRNDIRSRFKNVSPLIDCNDSEHFVDFTKIGGGTLWVRSMENVRSVRGAGANVSGVVVEEGAWMDLEKALKDVILPMLMDNDGWLIVISTTNAGKDGNQERRTPSYFNILASKFQDGEATDNWHFVHRTARDNPVIPKKSFDSLIAEYGDTTGAQYQQEIEAALLTSGTGVMFGEWRDKYHITKHEAPAHARWFGGLDWGYRSPGCFVLLAAEGERVQVRAEFKFEEMTPYDVGVTIGKMVSQWPLCIPEWIASDSAMWAVTAGGPSIAEEVQRGIGDALPVEIPALISTPKGKGSRVAGWALIHEYLKWEELEDGTCPAHLRPRLTFHTDCGYMIRTVASLPRDERNPEDADTDSDDHGADALRYALMSREPKADRPTPKIDQDIHPGRLVTGRRRSRDRSPETEIREFLEEARHQGIAPGGRYGLRFPH